jgi:transposase InsO family protein
VPKGSYGVYGVRKAWLAPHRDGISVARVQSEGLMRELGLVGVRRRGTKRCTIILDPAARSPGIWCSALSPRTDRMPREWRISGQIQRPVSLPVLSQLGSAAPLSTTRGECRGYLPTQLTATGVLREHCSCSSRVLDLSWSLGR